MTGDERQSRTTARGIAEATARLGYPVAEQHYFAGFVLLPEEASLWAEIDTVAERR